MMIKNGVVQALLNDLGHSVVSIKNADLEAHTKDTWPLAAKWTTQEAETHLPSCVVRPTNSEMVAIALKIAVKHACPVVPFGAGSGVTGAAVPQSGAIVIDLREMKEIVNFDPDNLMVTVEPGVMGGVLEQWLSNKGFTLGHYPQSLHLASVGGLVSTRSTGTFSSKYGGIEDLILGLEAVLPDGEVVKFRATPRSATGPNLVSLFVGAEGLFGIVTQITLRIFPIAEVRSLLGYTFPDLASGLKALRECFGRHLRPAVLRLYDANEATGLYGRVGLALDKPLLIVGHEGEKRVAKAEQDAFSEIATAFGAESLGAEIGNAWEAHRFDASWLDKGNGGPHLMADAIEVGVSWTGLNALYEQVMKEIQPLCAKVMGHYSHFYSTGGCIYFIFFVEGSDTLSVKEKYQAVWNTTMKCVLAMGGTVSHHHGIGLIRSEYMRAELGTGFHLLERLKQAIDPQNIMNPGKFGFSDKKA